jgi:penicillin-binding protein 2
MHGEKGTARRSAYGAKYRIAGKTGTAQVVGIAQDAEYDAEALEERHRDHALFIAFAPVDDPKIAVAVVVENGGGGSSTAAPIAREVMDAWLMNDYINDLQVKP